MRKYFLARYAGTLTRPAVAAAPRRPGLVPCLILAGAALAACGGSDDNARPAEPAAASRQVHALAVTPQQAALSSWTAPIALSVVPVAGTVLDNSRVLFWAADYPTQYDSKGGRSYTTIYDFSTQTATSLTVPTAGMDLFCSGTARLADGRLLIEGGNGNAIQSMLYDPVANSWSTGPSMNNARGYNASAPLADGSVLTFGGSWSGGTGAKPAEVYTTTGGWRTLAGVSTTDTTFITGDAAGYFRADNHMWLIPTGNGRVLHAGPARTMHWIDVTGNGSAVAAGTRGADTDSMNGNAVMYDAGKILTVGGGINYDGAVGKNTAYIIDTTQGSANVRQIVPMAYGRVFHNSVVLPSGQVVVLGGQTLGVGFSDANGVLTPELFDPQTETFTQLPAMSVARNYHSIGLLLPDGRVVSAGGGLCNCAGDHLNMQVLSPPYLFNSDGSAATRPVLTGTPATLAYGTTVTVTTDSPVTAFALVRVGAATHTVDNDQRRVALSYTGGAGNSYQLAVPSNPGILLPGQWMLFAMNAQGTPSLASFVTVSTGGAPVLANPGTVSASAAGVVNLALVASSGSGSLTFGASGLPAGLAIDPVAGVISGTATVPGSYYVTASVGNGTATVSTGFLLQVPGSAGAGSATPPVTSVPAPVAAAGVTVRYAPVLAAGVSAQFSWNFGDGSAVTAPSASAAASHVYAAPGVYHVALTVNLADGSATSYSLLQAVTATGSNAATQPQLSGNVMIEPRSGASSRLWVVNQDNNSVSVFDTSGNAKLAEIAVGTAPRALARASDGRVWVTNKLAGTISIISPATLAVVQTLTLARASQPWGIVFSPLDGSAFVTLEATGQLLKLNGTTGAQTASLSVGTTPRHLALTAAGDKLLVSRFITRPLPGEGTAAVSTADSSGNLLGGEVLLVNPATLTLKSTLVLRHSEKTDLDNQGRGIPNYLGAAAISPDGGSAWVPSKQDNVKRGTLRDGNALNFQSTVRGISSRLDLAALAEDYPARIDHDNAGVPSAARYHPSGAYLFVALETSRQVAVVDPVGKAELFRIEVGLAPEGLAFSADGSLLYVHNFMSRSVSVVDLSALLGYGQTGVATTATLPTVTTEALAANVLRGKQLFYDARDTRLARDSYLSCASCHNDAGNDGRTWDFTSLGEGLRNTIALRGRAGVGQGFMHWSANFDEVQDFEGQIRSFAGGTGLMTDAQFNTGTVSQPLGSKKTGLSSDLDALAAYLGSLTTFAPDPYRNADGSLTAAALAGRTVFAANCAGCHLGAGFTISGDASRLKNVGTIKASSGQRLFASLTGIDVPTLRDVWATAPYLHDGSAATLSAAISAHTTISLNATDLANVAAYVQQIGSEEPGPGTWTACATEGTTCALPAGLAADVYYGANGTYVMRSGLTGNVTCNVATFGFDPVNGAYKTCAYVVTGALTKVACAASGALCSLPAGSVGDVYYGSGTRYSVRSGVTAAVCSSAAFVNPTAGSTPACSYVVTAGASPQPASVLTPCAGEGGSCALPAGVTADVYYGANGKYGLRTGVTGSLACGVASYGADPVPSVVKSCGYVVTGSVAQTRCAASGGFCALPAGTSGDVYFGAGGKFSVRSGMTGVICAPAQFGGDPNAGATEACSYVVKP